VCGSLENSKTWPPTVGLNAQITHRFCGRPYFKTVIAFSGEAKFKTDLPPEIVHIR
jgi:hypothetical protein